MTNEQQDQNLHTKVDFVDEPFIRNPYPVYEELRKTEPIHRFLLPNGQYAWIVTTYAEAEKILKDSSRFMTSDPTQPEATEGEGPSPMRITSKNLLNMDFSDHRRLRQLVQKAFTPRMVENLRGRITEITNELLDKVQDKHEMNVIEDFAFPLPIIVICEMLGVPQEDQTKFRSWSNTILEGINDPSYAEKTEKALTEFISYIQDLIEQRRHDLKNDLISDLLRVEENGDQLTEHELIAMVFVLIIAGHETTVNLIGNGLLTLLEHPDQKEKLENNLELITPAIEEMLRYSGPVEVNHVRFAAEDVDIRDKTIKRGERVFISLASANRDAEKFDDPDTFDITREANNHLAFGKGIHFCLGAPLARLEAEIAVSALLQRMPRLRLTVDPGDLEWRPGMIVRGVKELPLAID